MKLQIEANKVEWWFWSVTLALICAAVAGFTPGYGAVMVLSALQVVWFAVVTGSLLSFPSQVRLVYLGITLLALWTPGRVWVFSVLAVGTAMVTLFGRCAIAAALAAMPWNRNAGSSCQVPSRSADEGSRHGKAA